VLEAWEATGSPGRLPDVGAMIETPGATERVAEIAAEADFLSIGTNDLVQYTLGLDRARPLATAHAAADPAVLALVSRVVEAARAERIAVEVCGEAAGELPLVVLFLGLGIDELSVAPARLDEVRAAIRRLSAESARGAAATALRAPAADRALALAEELLSAEAADELGQARDSVGGVLA
jgi:phosphoenolpyruvate-protein kinase (PTS system EI component)